MLKIEQSGSLTNPSNATIFSWKYVICRVKCGELEYYDKAYDRVNIKTEVPLAMVNRVFHKVTTTDDPVIRKVSKKRNTLMLKHSMALKYCLIKQQNDSENFFLFNFLAIDSSSECRMK